MSELTPREPDYRGIHGDIVALLENARRAAARSVNALMTASYWEIGRRIVEFEQGGKGRAKYGEALIERLRAQLGAEQRRVGELQDRLRDLEAVASARRPNR